MFWHWLSSKAILAVAFLGLLAPTQARAQTDVTRQGVQPGLTSGTVGYGGGNLYGRSVTYGYYGPYYGMGYGYYPYYAGAYTYTPGYYPVVGSYYSAYYNPAVTSYYSGYYNPSAIATQEANASAGSAQPTADRSAHLLVIVPPTADLWFNGSPTQQGGAERAFVSPPLTPGQDYTYEVVARWTNNGQPVEERRTIRVRSNQRSLIDLTQPAPAAAARAP